MVLFACLDLIRYDTYIMNKFMMYLYWICDDDDDDDYDDVYSYDCLL